MYVTEVILWKALNWNHKKFNTAEKGWMSLTLFAMLYVYVWVDYNEKSFIFIFCPELDLLKNFDDRK